MSPAPRLHDDQVDVSVDQVRALVAAQCPRWSGLPVSALASHGTVNALFRVGPDVVLRFPLCPRADGRAEIEAELAQAAFVARQVASRSAESVSVAQGLFVGEPGAGYPGTWSAWEWVPGAPAVPEDVDPAFVADLAGFVRTLHAAPTGGRAWRGAGRGGQLARYDAEVRVSLAAAAHLVDVGTLSAVWADALAAPRGDTPDRMLHADLMPGNLLVHAGRLAAVIDLGNGDVGDPAVDLMPLWNLLPAGSDRGTYAQLLGADDAMLRRGRGWALAQAAIALPYYEHTNPVMAATARRTLEALATTGVGHGEVTNKAEFTTNTAG